MRHIRVLICRVDDPASDQMTERAAFDLPATDVSTLQPETALDALETTTRETGNAILRRTFQAQSDLIDAELTEQHRRQKATLHRRCRVQRETRQSTSRGTGFGVHRQVVLQCPLTVCFCCLIVLSSRITPFLIWAP
jgi:hypothetical protein